MLLYSINTNNSISTQLFRLTKNKALKAHICIYIIQRFRKTAEFYSSYLYLLYFVTNNKISHVSELFILFTKKYNTHIIK